MPSWRCTACTFLNENRDKSICSMCDTVQIIVCARCSNDIIYGGRIMAAGNTYHRECFRCSACHQLFDIQQFQLYEGDPYHINCYKELFHPKCDVCLDHLPFQEGGQRIIYKENSFWKIKYCPSHESRDRCCSCHKIEPIDFSRKYEMLSDGRKICHDCSPHVVLDTDEAQEVVRDVWEFMASLGMTLPHVPVYLVDYSTLNEHRHRTHGSSSFTTRGICLSEVSEIRHMARLGGLPVPRLVRLQKTRSVNAILILHGLPYDLTASVLAHEATHAYIKLNDNFPDDIQLQVEEGLCQLISYLWLKYRQVMMDTIDGRDSYKTKLRNFYIHQMELDPSTIYGDGFRFALKAYNHLQSLQLLFDHVRLHQRFPL